MSIPSLSALPIAAVDPQTLPDGWKAQRDESGHPVYVNRATSDALHDVKNLI